MKVLQVIPSVSPAEGGPSHAIGDIERALAARGIEVTTVTTNDGDESGILTVPCGTPVATPYSIRWYFRKNIRFYKISMGLRQWLKINLTNYDVVHAHGLFSFAPIAAAYLARSAGIPYVLRPLGVLAQYGMTRRRPLLKKLSLELVERRVLASASAIHFTSIDEKNEADILRLHLRGVVIPLGIQINGLSSDHSVKSAFTPGSLDLLFLSRIDPKKNVEGLLRAISLIVSKFPHLTLTIAGAGEPEYVASLQTLAGKLGLVDHVNWLGFVQGARKADTLKAATVFVQTSFSENFGIAVAEALAAGLPCVVSKHVAISREIEAAQTGIVVDTHPQSIAAGIETLISYGEGLTAMSSAARALAHREFSLDVMGKRLEELYRDCLAERHETRMSSRGASTQSTTVASR